MAFENKKRVYFEDIKAQHTSHWDLDYLSRAELDSIYRKNRREGGLVKRKPKRILHRKTWIALLAGSAAVLLAVLLVLFIR